MQNLIIFTKNIFPVEKLRRLFKSEEEISKGMLIVVGCLGFTALLAQFNNTNSQANPQPAHESFIMDTTIPPGYALAPIQVSNYENLDRLIGQMGVVDLYIPSLNPRKKAKLVMKAVQIVRTGENFRHFGILVNENQAAVIASHIGEFSVSVRNPKTVGTEIVKHKPKRTFKRVIYQSE